MASPPAVTVDVALLAIVLCAVAASETALWLFTRSSPEPASAKRALLDLKREKRMLSPVDNFVKVSKLERTINKLEADGAARAAARAARTAARAKTAGMAKTVAFIALAVLYKGRPVATFADPRVLSPLQLFLAPPLSGLRYGDIGVSSLVWMVNAARILVRPPPPSGGGLAGMLPGGLGKMLGM